METQRALCDVSSRSFSGIPRVSVFMWSKDPFTSGINQTKVKMLPPKFEVQKYFYFQRGQATIAVAFQTVDAGSILKLLHANKRTLRMQETEALE